MYLTLIVVGALSILLIAYLVYQNFKDEKIFEQEADDTHAQPHHPDRQSVEDRQ